MMRQFQSASGRTWSVEVAPIAERPTDPRADVDVSAKVLRFMSPGLCCDLKEWPQDWEKLPQPELLTLLDKALTEWVSSGRS